MKLKILDRTLAVTIIVVLSLGLIIEFANLIGFGSQEVFLNHPDYPEGDAYKEDVKFWFVLLFLLVCFTFSLFILIIRSRVKKQKQIFNKLFLLFLMFPGVLSIGYMIEGPKLVGIITWGIVLVLMVMVLIKKNLEKTRE